MCLWFFAVVGTFFFVVGCCAVLFVCLFVFLFWTPCLFVFLHKNFVESEVFMVRVFSSCPVVLLATVTPSPHSSTKKCIYTWMTKLCVFHYES